MHQNETYISRRSFLKYLGVVATTAATLPFFPSLAWPASQTLLTRRIPGTQESIPIVGMGTWQTFHVGNDVHLRNARTEVLQTFLTMGGGMVDSSPMYGSAEEVLGYAINKIGSTPSLFSATKVWTPFTDHGIAQINDAHKLWGLPKFDLLQIHNLVNWEKHLDTLLAYKQQGLVRYIGITTSHGRRHDLFEKVMKSAPIDFVQFTYNILDREAENRLLPVAQDHELGVIINRPFQGGVLFDHLDKYPIPSFASDFDCTNWAQVLLKFIASHPAVTCAIPATSRVDHMQENMGALNGRLPDSKERQLILKHITSL